MGEQDSEDATQSTADMTVFVQNLLEQMQSRFQAMSDSIVTKNILFYMSIPLPQLSISSSCGKMSSLYRNFHVKMRGREEAILPAYAIHKDQPKLWVLILSAYVSIWHKNSFITSFMNITLDEMGNRINDLEQSINDMKTEMGAEGSLSPMAPSKPEPDAAKPEDGSA
ncbi:hypothetical protein HHK36_012430 [Tetracentron sinense]|uniref:Heat shock factor-binding protein 1 n=1 Tax=Tetracentron sinense TaxID=13715 RepID=A0A834Z8P9_TETSI|nr:hypothetical protein HHK36_012430 [Tetracentron sinense]